MAAATATQTESIGISAVGVRTAVVPIRGTAPLLVHKFSEKARRQMLDNMQGRRKAKESKDPQAEYEAAAYRLADGGYGFPAIGFKSSIVGAARYFGKEVSMVGLRQMLFVDGEMGEDGQKMVRILGSEPTMREDVVRVGVGGTDLRYRPQFNDWTAVLHVKFVASALTNDSILALINAAGMGVGVGEWRPEKRGDFGTYEVDLTEEVIFQ